jgi:hypothetical protein
MKHEQCQAIMKNMNFPMSGSKPAVGFQPLEKLCLFFPRVGKTLPRGAFGFPAPGKPGPFFSGVWKKEEFLAGHAICLYTGLSWLV